MSDTDFSIQRQLDAICDEFEENWSAKQASDIESKLGRVEESHRDRLLRMLIEIDVELRRKAGQTILPEDYEKLGKKAAEIVSQLVIEDSDETLPPSPSPEEPKDNLVTTKSLPASQTPRAGRQIGPYKLLQQIGEGGMGSVWMAEQEKPVRRRVALKLIRADMGSKETIARFEAERQALAMMNHQNIARVLDAGTTENGSPYFVMELVKGIPLTQYCDDNKLSINERLELFVPVCKAVQHAHHKGIIHRDLKPSNVLVTLCDGEAVPKVIDFGLAKALEHTTKLTDKTMFTEFGKVVGTLQYMSPEQAEMNALDVDTRTDIYSLGVMLYELLTGSTPLDKETLGRNALLQVLQIIREKEPPRPSHRLSSSGDAATGISQQRRIAPAKLQQILRGELDWVVMKALEKDRRRRYESAASFADELNLFLNNEAVNARPPSLGYKFSKFVIKNRVAVSTISLVFVLLVAGLFGTSFGLFYARRAQIEATNQKELANKRLHQVRYENQRAESEKKRAIQEATKAKQNEQVAIQAKSKMEAQFYSNQLARADFEWQFGRPQNAWRLLDRCKDGLRGWEHDWVYSKMSSNHEILMAECFASIAKLSFASLPPTSVHISSIAMSPVENIVAISVSAQWRGIDPDVGGFLDEIHSSVQLWSTEDQSFMRELPLQQSQVTSSAFSPDGKLLAFGCNDRTIRVWNLEKAEFERSLHGHKRDISCLDFSNDGKLVSAEGRASVLTAPDSEISEIIVWDITTFTNSVSRRITLLPAFSINSVEFVGNGSSIIAAGGNRDQDLGFLELLDASSLKTQRKFNTTGNIISATKRDRADQIIACGRTSISLYETNDVDALEVHLVSTDYALTCALPGTRDDNFFITNEIGQLILYNTETTHAESVWKSQAGAIFECLVSTDRSFVVTGGVGGEVEKWDILKPSDGLILGTSDWPINCVDVTSDGSLVVVGTVKSELIIWDTTTRRRTKVLKGHKRKIISASFNDSGSRIVSISEDATARVWDVLTGEEVAKFEGLKGHDVSAQFGKEAGKVLLNYDQGMFVWIYASNSITQLFDRKFVKDFSSSGEKRLISVVHPNMREIRLHNYLNGDFAIFKGMSHTLNDARPYVLNQDATILLTGYRDHLDVPPRLSLDVWDVNENKLMSTLEGHSKPLADAVFISAGKNKLDKFDSIFGRRQSDRILTVARDGILKIWNPVNGIQLYSYRMGEPLSGVSIDDQCETLVITGTKSIWIWKLAGRRLSHLSASRFLDEFWENELSGFTIEHVEIPPLPNERQLWRKTVISQNGRRKPTTKLDVELLRQICQLYPDKHYAIMTLAVAEYRIGDFERSAATAQTCIEQLEARAKEINVEERNEWKRIRGKIRLMPVRLGAESSSPEALVLAILAMSNYRLGNYEMAGSYRARLETAMKTGSSSEWSFPRGSICLHAEVNDLFTKSTSEKRRNDN